MLRRPARGAVQLASPDDHRPSVSPAGRQLLALRWRVTLDDQDAIVRGRLASYARHFSTRRQIHSNRANRLESFGRGYAIVSIAIAAAVAFVGFSGTDKFGELLAGWHHFDANTLTFMYNGLVLAILIITVLGLIYRFDERASRHRNAIEKLTNFIRDAEDAIALSQAAISPLTIGDLDVFRERYKGTADALPPTTDRQFERAKKDLANKERTSSGSAPSRWIAEGNTVDLQLAQRLADVLMRPTQLPVLEIVRDALSPDAWIAGGFVRDAVWDLLHEYQIATPLDDVDVIHFNLTRRAKTDDEALEKRLAMVSSNVHWSVKNEARMHIAAGDDAYTSLADAMRRAPETATAVAVRLDADGVLHLLAPLGLSDLFSGIVRATPGLDLSRFQKRAAAKSWVTRWPNVVVVEPPDSVSVTD